MREGWKRVKLGEIITLRRGLTYKKDDEVGFSEKIVLRSNNVNLLTHLFDYDELKYLRSDFDIPADKYIKQGELLMCMSNGSKAHLGKVALYDGEDDIYAFGGFMSAISHNDLIASKFLYYALITSRFKDYINTLSAGANINNLKTKDIDAYSIELPSLEEQHRIVELLDAEFAKIDAIKANAEKQLQWAKDLLNKSISELTSFQLGWNKTKLKELCSIKGEYGLNESATTFNGIRYLRITDITADGELNDEKVSAENKEGKSQKKLEPGDILFARTGATVGKTLVYKEEFGDCNFAGYLIRYRTNPSIILPQYLFYYTHSSRYYEWVIENQAAAAQPNISAQKYNELEIDFPKDIEAQQTIVEKLDTLSEKVKQLQLNYEKTIALCNDLKQSLLKDIFG